jgi:hypothetical protein
VAVTAAEWPLVIASVADGRRKTHDTAVLIYCAGNTAIYREMIILRYVLLCTGRYLSDHYLSGRYLSLYMLLQKCQVLAGRLA